VIDKRFSEEIELTRWQYSGNEHGVIRGMDSWSATNKIMIYIDDLGKYYYCPLKRNRLVDDTAGNEDYKKISNLSWEQTERKTRGTRGRDSTTSVSEA
jgi:hypothetical protein